MKSMRQTAILGLTAAAVFALAVGSAQATIYNWVGGTSSDWEIPGNWGANGKPTSGVAGAHRLNIGSGTTTATNPLIYTSAQGTTTFSGSDRGLVIYKSSAMEIQSGTFTTAGSSEDAVGLSGGTATLTISGGTYNANAATIGLTVGFNSDGIFNINSGAANITTLRVCVAGSGTYNGTVNLNGGTLSVNNITAGTGANINTTLLLNGGTLTARQDNTAFITADLKNLRVGTNGAKIDTAGFNVTIPKALTPDGASAGGLIKSGAGTLTLSGANTYTGETKVTAGTLALTGSGSIANSATITVDSGATLDASGITGGLALGSGQTLAGAGTIAGDLAFGSGAKFLFSATDTLNYTGTSPIGFTDFSLSSLVGLDGNTVAINTYTLISGNTDLTFSGISNVGYDNRDDIGGGKQAYFEEGSLKLVVIPEPATFGIVLSALAALVIRRRRMG